MADVDELFTVNRKVQIKVASSGRSAFYNSRVEDVQPGVLGVATPMDATGLVRFPVGLKVWLVAATSEAAFQVSAKVVGESLHPVAITWVSEFGPAERIQRRRFFRVTDPPATIHRLQVKGIDSQFFGRIVDLSAGGMLLETTEKLAAEAVLSIDFTLANAGRFVTDAEIVRIEISEASRERRYRYGCKFTSLTWREEDMIIFGLFCFQRDLRRKGLK